MGLASQHAVGDMDAGRFELTGEGDILFFVESGAEFDQAGNLLAFLGGADERIDKGRVSAGAVEGEFDCQHIGIGRSCFDETLDGIGEGFIGMVDEDILLADFGEDVGFGVGQCARADGFPERFFELWAVDPCDLVEIDACQRAGADEVVVLGDFELGEEEVEDPRRWVGRGLDTYSVSEPAHAELFFDMLKQVFDIFVIELDRCAADEPKWKNLDDAHPGEEVVEVVDDDLIEGDQESGSVLGWGWLIGRFGIEGVGADEMREHIGDFDPSKAGLSGA